MLWTRQALCEQRDQAPCALRGQTLCARQRGHVLRHEGRCIRPRAYVAPSALRPGGPAHRELCIPQHKLIGTVKNPRLIQYALDTGNPGSRSTDSLARSRTRAPSSRSWTRGTLQHSLIGAVKNPHLVQRALTQGTLVPAAQAHIRRPGEEVRAAPGTMACFAGSSRALPWTQGAPSPARTASNPGRDQARGSLEERHAPQCLVLLRGSEGHQEVRLSSCACVAGSGTRLVQRVARTTGSGPHARQVWATPRTCVSTRAPAPRSQATGWFDERPEPRCRGQPHDRPGLRPGALS